jgi:hypothetical protein
LLLLVGLTNDANSHVAIGGERLRVRFGWFLVGVVASMRGVVQIRFRERQRVGGIIPLINCDAIGWR